MPAWAAGDRITADRLNDSLGIGRNARYRLTVDMGTQGSNTTAAVPWDVVDLPSTDVTRSSDLKTFTLNRSGLWLINGDVRVLTISGASEVIVSLDKAAGTRAERYGSSQIYSTAAGQNPGLAFTCTREFTAGDTIAVNIQGSNSTWAAVHFNTTEQTNISLTWLRPSA